MRVGLVIYGSLDSVSGGYLYDRKLVEALRRAGDQVDVISLPWRSYARHLTDNWSADLISQMARDYDVLLQDELNHPSLAWANGRMKPPRPLLVSIVHHLRVSEPRPRWQNRFYRLVERHFLRSVDAFIFNSHTTRRAVEEIIDCQLPHVVAYPGGDHLPASPMPRTAALLPEDSPLRLQFVGNLIPRKGLHTLLRALVRVKGDWRLSVVGSHSVDPAYARRMLRMAEDSGIGQRIAWPGPLSDNELAGEMASADVLAVPSEYEGFGIVYLEGMRFGLPALATTAGAASEIITDGENGFLVEPGDAQGLGSRIEALASDRDRLARMSAAARRRYASHPTWEATTTAIREFLVELLNREHG